MLGIHLRQSNRKIGIASCISKVILIIRFIKNKIFAGSQNKSYEGQSFKHEFVCLDNLLKHGNFPSIENPIMFGSIEMQANTTFENQKIVEGIKYVARRYKDGNEFGKPAKSIDVIKENLVTHEVKTIHLNKHDFVKLNEEFKKNSWTRDNKKWHWNCLKL